MRCLCQGMVAACLLSTTTPATAGPSPSDFRFTTAIQGDYPPNAPVSVPLSREIMAETKPDFADVRVFDDMGQETPYVIYKQTEAHKTPKPFVFEIVSYDDAEDSDKITLKRPDGAPAFREIELMIAGRDFKKHIQVEAGAAPDAMQKIATDTIFDFSSRLDLRKTAVAIPETDTAFLRIGLSDEAQPPPDSPEMRLQYEGLEFWTQGTGAGPFRVDHILGWSGERKAAEHYFDHFTIDRPTVSTDNDGNSVIHLDAKLPVAHVTFDVENSYYCRRIQLLTAAEDVDEAYRVAAGGVIYKIPGVAESENTITFDQPSRYLRLKVLNDDNPPVRVRGVTVAWVRRNLYFVPEPGRTYTLHVGSDVAASPRYELSQLIPSDFAKLRHYASMSVLGLRPNASYDPRLRPSTREAVEEVVFVGLVVILVCVLALWAFRLLKKMPVQANE